MSRKCSNLTWRTNVPPCAGSTDTMPLRLCRMIRKSDGTIPPPPGGPAPVPPATTSQVGMNSRVAAWSHMASDHQDCEFSTHSDISDSESSYQANSCSLPVCVCVCMLESDDAQRPYGEHDESPEMTAVQIDRDVVNIIRQIQASSSVHCGTSVSLS